MSWLLPGGPAHPGFWVAWKHLGASTDRPDAGRLQGSWEDQPSALDIPTAWDGKVTKAGSS